MNTEKSNLKALADAFCRTDTQAIKKDVIRLGGVRAASIYCADLAAGQEYYAALDSAAGRAALRKSISAILK